LPNSIDVLFTGLLMAARSTRPLFALNSKLVPARKRRLIRRLPHTAQLNSLRPFLSLEGLSSTPKPLQRLPLATAHRLRKTQADSRLAP
jgi:hypothetical protein